MGAPRKGNSRHLWDDSESDLLVALRARNLSYSSIRERHFPHWSTVGLSLKLRRLMKETRWEAKNEEILKMGNSEQLALIDHAKATVALRRRQRAPQRQDREGDGEVAENRVALDETGGDQPLEGNPLDEDVPKTSHIEEPLDGERMNEDIVDTAGSTGRKKRKFSVRKAKRQQFTWGDDESELLVALRALGFSYAKISERDFQGWSQQGLRRKFLKIIENESRWKLRFEALQRKDKYEQLAIIALAQGAVARSRIRRVQGEREDEAEDPVSENAVEIPESPDPDVARSVPSGKDDNPNLDDEGENQGDGKPKSNHSDRDNTDMRPPRDRRIPARYRDGWQ